MLRGDVPSTATGLGVISCPSFAVAVVPAPAALAGPTVALDLTTGKRNWYFQGAAQKGWPIGLLDQLKTIPASAFVAVDESCLRIAPNSGRARPSC